MTEKAQERTRGPEHILYRARHPISGLQFPDGKMGVMISALLGCLRARLQNACKTGKSIEIAKVNFQNNFFGDPTNLLCMYHGKYRKAEDRPLASHHAQSRPLLRVWHIFL